MLKPVLLLCGLVSLAAALRPTEGSGGQLSDMEDLEDVREDDSLLGLEGSGDDDDDWDLLRPVLPGEKEKKQKTTTTATLKRGRKKIIMASPPVKEPESQFEYDIHLSQLDENGNNDDEAAAAPEVGAVGTEKAATKKTDDLYEYYDDLYPEEYKDLIKNYDDNNDDDDDVKDEDYNYTDSTADFDRDSSVLKIDEKKTTTAAGDIEIKPRPTAAGPEEAAAILETSQIFIMVGSAFVSFAIVMLTFFLCRRAMAKKRAKKAGNLPASFAYSSPDAATRTVVVKESSIVKDYQKVPTSTKEMLQYHSTRIDMYRGKEEEEAEAKAASAPLVQ